MKRGQRRTIAIISDLHIGSEYCREEALRDFVEWAYERGARTILGPGDLLDGHYDNHGQFETSQVGVTKQALRLLRVLPKRPGLRYELSLGNHDATYSEAVGLDLVGYLNMLARENGRDDITVHSHVPRGGMRGAREVFLEMHGVEVCLWHPRGGFSLAAMRKQIRGFPPGVRPRFMFVGHWHIGDRVVENGCEAFSCQSFQGGGSDFGQSLSGSTTVGGLVVSWEESKYGIHSVAFERREYPEPVKAVKVNRAPARKARAKKAA